MYEGRRTPIRQLMKKLGIEEYNHASAFNPEKFTPDRILLPMSQHMGAQAVPVVVPGQKVACGDLIGEIPSGNLGARLHSSISGVVKSAGSSVLIERE